MSKDKNREARELAIIFADMRREAHELVDEINRPGWVKAEFARLLDQKIEGSIKRKKHMHMVLATQSVRLRHRHITRTNKFVNKPERT
jgi:hypothetical protein